VPCPSGIDPCSLGRRKASFDGSPTQRSIRGGSNVGSIAPSASRLEFVELRFRSVICTTHRTSTNAPSIRSGKHMPLFTQPVFAESHTHDRTNLNPSLPVGVPPLLNVAASQHQISFLIPDHPLRRGVCLPSASSHALPAPTPNPTHAGHALRLKRRTEKTMPKEAPRVERMRNEEIAWSH